MGSDSDLKTMAAAEEVRACLTLDRSVGMEHAQGLLMTRTPWSIKSILPDRLYVITPTDQILPL